MRPYDNRPCDLGEGVFWHPERAQYFWFDILNRCLYAKGEAGQHSWHFDRMVSAGAATTCGRLLLATETGLAVLDLQSGSLSAHHAVEAGQAQTRSNDGRADRQGGFWFGTMGKAAEPGAGAIYRYYRGRVERLVDAVSIPNAICFSPDGQLAYYADTAQQKLWAQPLDAQGWPQGAPSLFLDLGAEGLYPDGAVTDREGGIWIAKWGAAAVMRYTPEGRRSHVLAVGGAQASCPAFGGPELSEMLVTTARTGLQAADANQGLPWLIQPGFLGLAEPKVVLA